MIRLIQRCQISNQNGYRFWNVLVIGLENTYLSLSPKILSESYGKYDQKGRLSVIGSICFLP